jgi:hypothetical protein
MKRFTILLQREWMQHRFGWLVLMGLPTGLMLLAALFGAIHVELGEQAFDRMPPPFVFAAGCIGASAVLTMGLVWMSSMLQSNGLARRDVQDRSIEFWLSLPASHSQSIGATLLMHLLLAPWAALLAGLAGGFLLSIVAVVRLFGIGDWLALPWGTIAATTFLLTLRVMIGLLLATLWLSPLVLGSMAASAWLKRWGLPAVVGAVVVGGTLLDRLYGNRIVWDVLHTLGTKASQAFLGADRGSTSFGIVIERNDDFAGALAAAPGWLLHDLGSALAQLASPVFLVTLMSGAGAFGLLVLRRQHHA